MNEWHGMCFIQCRCCLIVKRSELIRLLIRKNRKHLRKEIIQTKFNLCLVYHTQMYSKNNFKLFIPDGVEVMVCTFTFALVIPSIRNCSAHCVIHHCIFVENHTNQLDCVNQSLCLKL